MVDVTRTTTLLLEGLRDDGNAPAWTEFDLRYRPILMGFLRALGAREVDAADAAQETLLEFLRAHRAGEFVRGKGRLRNWLMSVGRTRWALARRRAGRRREVEDGDASPERSGSVADPAAPSDDHVWETERRRVILREAFDRLKSHSASDERTLEAFDLLVFRAVPPAAVAVQCGMTIEDVYQAKSRTTKRLRHFIEEVEGAFDEDAG